MEIEKQIQILKETTAEYARKSMYIPEIANLSPDDFNHVVQIGTSCLMTKYGIGCPGGSFVQAIIDNNLAQAVAAADDTNIKLLKFYVMLLHNVTLPKSLWEFVK